MQIRCISIILTCLLFPLLAFSVPTGLNMIPTAESLPKAKSSLTYETQGTGKLYVPDGSTIYGTEIGAVFGFEGGIDQVSDKGPVLNAKWVFRSEGLLFPAMAVGVQNVHSGDKSQYYAVATKSLLPKDLLKAHAGLMRLEGDTVVMFGASATLGALVFKADRVNGGIQDGSALSVGFKSSNYTITGTRYFMDNRKAETTVSLTYLYSGL